MSLNIYLKKVWRIIDENMEVLENIVPKNFISSRMTLKWFYEDEKLFKSEGIRELMPFLRPINLRMEMFSLKDALLSKNIPIEDCKNIRLKWDTPLGRMYSSNGKEIFFSKEEMKQFVSLQDVPVRACLMEDIAFISDDNADDEKAAMEIFKAAHSSIPFLQAGGYHLVSADKMKIFLNVLGDEKEKFWNGKEWPWPLSCYTGIFYHETY